MRNGDLYRVVAGVLVASAVIGLAGFVVVALSATTPLIIAAVLTAFAAVLAAIPPIIKAFWPGTPGSDDGRPDTKARSADAAREPHEFRELPGDRALIQTEPTDEQRQPAQRAERVLDTARVELATLRRETAEEHAPGTPRRRRGGQSRA